MKVSPIILFSVIICWFIGLLLFIGGSFDGCLIMLGIGFVAVSLGKIVRKMNTPQDFTPQDIESQNKLAELKRSGMPYCKRCLNTNIQFSFVTTGQQSAGTIEKKKRSAVERAANKAGRGFANLYTLGIYGAVAPKKGKYKEYTKTNTTVYNQKVALCQTCGYSWNVK